MLGPQRLEVGDAIAVIQGVGRPMVLRPVSDSKYQVVGPCCIHTLNWGEALVGPLPPGWRLRLSGSLTSPGPALFMHEDAESPTRLDPRIDWTALVVEEEDDRRDKWLSENSAESYRRPDIDYLATRGLELQAITLI